MNRKPILQVLVGENKSFTEMPLTAELLVLCSSVKTRPELRSRRHTWVAYLNLVYIFQLLKSKHDITRH